MPTPQTLFEKIWCNHLVGLESGYPAVLYIDLHLIHEVTSPQAFSGLRKRGLIVRRPDKSVATADHSTSTVVLDQSVENELAARQIEQLEKNCQDFGICFYGIDSQKRGIVHVIGPELGLTQPGMTIVCGDSHTATHGAFGSLAFGIGTSEVEHVLATQCLLQYKLKTCEVRIDGKLLPGVTAKDVILALIAKIGVGGGTGYVFEYTGSTVRSLNMEERMTLCNMTIEGGARAGMVAPDDTTYEYLSGRAYAPKDEKWEQSLSRWRSLPSDEGAVYDKTIMFDASSTEPMITYGTNPGMGMPISACIPDPDKLNNLDKREALIKALRYFKLQPGKPLLGHPINAVFIGSCTNSRISDLRAAAHLFKNRKVAQGVRVLVVPGSQSVKSQAEAEGLDRIFIAAGAEWRHAGCSMCIAMNGDYLESGQYAVSTSNRNFEGRQGKGSRTFLASPLTASAAALTGRITDVREMLQ